MKKENHFSKKLKQKSDAELRQYIDDKEKFQPDAVQAAIWELELRGEKSKEASNFEKQLNQETQKKEKSITDNLGIPVNTVKPGIRFVHFLIDGFIIEAFITAINTIPSIELAHFFGLLLYPIYYTFFEYHYQWTPGKLISNTIVVDENGERPSIRIIILRTFARYVPFEAFSCLGENSWGWHDRWTKTYVIDKKDLPLLRERKQLTPVELVPLKLSKTAYLLAGGLIGVLIISSIVTKNMNSRLTAETEQWIVSLDNKDYKNIIGEWNTGDSELRELNFISGESVISNNLKLPTQNLNYKISNRVLTIVGAGLSEEFIVVQSTVSEIHLVDIDNPMVQIVWKRK